jgi:hypothetical protein
MSHPASLIASERIIGVRAVPAEAAPGDLVQYSVLVASPLGTVQAQDTAWSLCKLRKPVAENTPVSQACLTESLSASAQGGVVSIPTPSAACVNFGPLAPATLGGTLRPTDPDPTLGYYQPVRLDRGAEQVIFRERLHCELAGASLLLSQAFRDSYTINQNPTLVSLAASLGDAPLALDALPAGQRIPFVVTWSADSAESFPVFDSVTQTLVEQRESLWLSWFATAGVFESSATGRNQDDTATWTVNTWQTPPMPGSVFVWLVLHDSRGGVAFASYTLTVVP